MKSNAANLSSRWTWAVRLGAEGLGAERPWGGSTGYFFFYHFRDVFRDVFWSMGERMWLKWASDYCVMLYITVIIHISQKYFLNISTIHQFTTM